MKILLLGATGRVGNIILNKIEASNYSANILVRSPEKLDKEYSQIKIFEGNVLNQEDILEAIEGCDAVISALNTDGGYTLSQSMPFIVSGMEKHKIKRIITVGTAGILQARSNPSIFRYQSNESKRKTTRAAEDHQKAYECLSSSNLDWTVICPTYLPDGEEIGEYRVEKTFLPKNGEKIHVPDVADFAYKQLFTNEFVGERVGIAY